MNNYRILGISRHATLDEIKKAYKTLALKYHPDKQNGNDEMFKTISKAYQEILEERKQNEVIVRASNPFDAFQDMFQEAIRKTGNGYCYSKTTQIINGKTTIVTEIRRQDGSIRRIVTEY